MKFLNYSFKQSVLIDWILGLNVMYIVCNNNHLNNRFKANEAERNYYLFFDLTFYFTILCKIKMAGSLLIGYEGNYYSGVKMKRKLFSCLWAF